MRSFRVTRRSRETRLLEMCSGSEAGSYLRLIDLCIRLESNKEEEEPAPPVSTAKLPLPHGGVHPFHQKSTCSTQLTLGPYVGQIWSRNSLELRGGETFVAHRVDCVVAGLLLPPLLAGDARWDLPSVGRRHDLVRTVRTVGRRHALSCGCLQIHKYSQFPGRI